MKWLKLPPERTGIIARHWHNEGWYEHRMLSHIQALRIEGAYLDVGANIGNHTVFFASECPSTHVYAVEPSDEAIGVLNEFAELNDLASKITVIPYAASDSDTIEVEFPRKGVVPFKAVKLDEVVAPGIKLVKMDIEGAEPSALRGMTRILAEDQPRLFIEAHTDEDMAATLSVIGPLGYRATGNVFNASPTYEFVLD
ncbi:FkbM family methyltransferase [Sphingomonas piscis]|uniref:FkbM family methyltransferase n=1 Tax=Sphingomonas piscis TaxID=2714943 RepID=A0A6G7YSE2_9SPHN|nr:FkbM family methyltransferase [Sphingomonas piscis]QIK79665.1 FkbM family methyltransferase [Sphingomonas piscis]